MTDLSLNGSLDGSVDATLDGTATAASTDEPRTRPAVLDLLLRVGPTTLLVGVGLSVFEVVLLSRIQSGGLLPTLLALLMTGPVIFARLRPRTTAGVLAAAAVLNGLLFPDLVRCGGAFPAILYVTFLIGVRSTTVLAALIGLVPVAVSVLAQGFGDPQLRPGLDFGAFAALLVVPLLFGGVLVGRLLRRRTR